jgi:glycogen phosphorylase
MKYKLRYVIDEQGLDNAIGLELLALKPEQSAGDKEVYFVQQFKMIGHEGNNYTFETTVEPDVAGTFRTCVRMYPKNANLPHRQDFCYVRWLNM